MTQDFGIPQLIITIWSINISSFATQKQHNFNSKNTHTHTGTDDPPGHPSHPCRTFHSTGKWIKGNTIRSLRVAHPFKTSKSSFRHKQPSGCVSTASIGFLPFIWRNMCLVFSNKVVKEYFLVNSPGPWVIYLNIFVGTWKLCSFFTSRFYPWTHFGPNQFDAFSHALILSVASAIYTQQTRRL